MHDALQEIRNCLESEQSYKKNSKQIIQEIANHNQIHANALVDTVKDVMEDGDEESVAKFLSLYFLKEAMDTRDPDLVNYVRERLLVLFTEIEKEGLPDDFPTKSEEKVYKNVERLIRECLIFWAEWFGEEGEESFGYKSAFDEIKGKIEMPKKFLFFETKKTTSVPTESKAEGSPEKVSNEENRLQVDTDEKQEEKDSIVEKCDENRESRSDHDPEVIQAIRICLKDEDSYKKNRRNIIKQINSDNRSYTQALVDIIRAAMNDVKESSVSKFISLYFLKEAMDTKNPYLVTYVKDNLLEDLKNMLEGGISKVFSSMTDNRVLKNFNVLLHECLIIWAEWFGDEEYGSTFKEAKGCLERPNKYFFFKISKKEQQPEKKSVDNVGNDDNLDMFQRQEHNKNSLKEALTDDRKLNFHLLQSLNEKFKKLEEELKESANDLLLKGSSEETLNKVITESDFTSKYLYEYQLLEAAMNRFKSSMLTASKASTTVKTSEHKDKEDQKPLVDHHSEAVSKQNWFEGFNVDSGSQEQQKSFESFNTTSQTLTDAFTAFDNNKIEHGSKAESQPWPNQFETGSQSTAPKGVDTNFDNFENFNTVPTAPNTSTDFSNFEVIDAGKPKSSDPDTKSTEVFEQQ